jgi:hypothetical protein
MPAASSRERIVTLAWLGTPTVKQTPSLPDRYCLVLSIKKITKKNFIYFSQKIDEWIFGFFQFFCFSDFLRPFYNQIRRLGYYSMGNFIFYHNPIRKYRKNIIFGPLEAKNTFS